MCSAQNADKRHFWCLSFSYMTFRHYTEISQQTFLSSPLSDIQSLGIQEELGW